MNVDLIKYEAPTTFDYFSMFASYNFMPCVVLPTRLTTQTLVDHIFFRPVFKTDQFDFRSGNILTDMTDHLPVFIQLTHSKNQQAASNRPMIRIFSERNITRFKEIIADTNWEIS